MLLNFLDKPTVEQFNEPTAFALHFKTSFFAGRKKLENFLMLFYLT
jgi:hypothetical protein